MCLWCAPAPAPSGAPRSQKCILCKAPGDGPNGTVRLTDSRAVVCVTCGHFGGKDTEASRNLRLGTELFSTTGVRPEYLCHSKPGVTKKYNFNGTRY